MHVLHTSVAKLVKSACIYMYTRKTEALSENRYMFACMHAFTHAFIHFTGVVWACSGTKVIHFLTIEQGSDLYKVVGSPFLTWYFKPSTTTSFSATNCCLHAKQPAERSLNPGRNNVGDLVNHT